MMGMKMKLLDKPHMLAVIIGSVDWMGLLIVKITKMIRMGESSSRILIIMKFRKTEKCV